MTGSTTSFASSTWQSWASLKAEAGLFSRPEAQVMNRTMRESEGPSLTGQRELTTPLSPAGNPNEFISHAERIISFKRSHIAGS
jgi:hypothetical protein